MTTPPTATKRAVFSHSKSTLTPCRRLGLSRPSPGNLKKSSNENGNTPDGTKVKETKDDFHQRIECREKCLNSRLDKNQCLKDRDRLETSQENLRSTVKRVLIDCNVTTSNSNNLIQLEYPKESTLKHDATYQVKKRKLSVKSKLIEDDKEFIKNLSITPVKSVDKLGVSDTEPVINTIRIEESNLNEVTSEMIQQLLETIKTKRKKLELLKVQKTYAKKHQLEEVKAQTARWRAAGQEALRYSVTLATQAGLSVTLHQLMTQHGFPPHLMNYNEEDDEFH